MKCIQHILTGEIHRVSDDEAWSKIEGDKLQPPVFKYVPKSAYKAQKSATKTTED